MLRLIRWLPLILAVTLVPGCAMLNQRAATRAIADAEQAYAKIAVQARNLVPDQAKAIEDGITTAKAKLATDVRGVLADCKGLNDKIRALAALKQRLQDVGQPPAEMPERTQFDTIHAQYGPLAGRWDEARSLSVTGKLAEACAKGEDVKATAVQLIAELQTGS